MKVVCTGHVPGCHNFHYSLTVSIWNTPRKNVDIRLPPLVLDNADISRVYRAISLTVLQASVSRRGSRPGNSFQRRPWRTFSAKASEKKVVPCAGLMGMQESHSYDSRPARRSWLPSSSASAKPSASGGNSVPPGCLQESNSEGRVCAHCGTTKTPLWRNGPQGPKVCMFVCTTVPLAV